MRRRPARRWLQAVLVILVVLAGASVYAWPTVVRHVFLSRVQALAQRWASVEAVSLNPFTGRLAIRGLRVLDRDGMSPFADVGRVDVRVRPLALLTGHLWIREASIDGSTVRVVRLDDGFNFSDLLGPSPSPARRWLDVTVDRLVVTGGTVTLEDRALAEPRTWTSEQIEIEAHNLSTRRDDGTAVARSLTAGAPVSLEMRRMRLYPIHLEAVVTTTGLDLTLAQVYLPPGAVTLERGRASSTVTVMLDAREGVRAQVRGQVQDLVVATAGQREPALVVPALGLELADFLYQDDRVAVGKLELSGAASVRDPRGPGRRRHVSTLRASIADVTWPVTTAGRLDVEGSVPGGGMLRLTGRLRPPPDASQLRMRITRADVKPWAELVPTTARFEGMAEADLSVDEPLAPAVPTRVRGAVAVTGLGITDGQREILRARRVEARDLEVQWPLRVAARRLVVSGPRATIERDAHGGFPVRDLLVASAPDTARAAAGARTDEAGVAPPPRLAVEEIVVRDGAALWQDHAVKPTVTADFTGLEARVSGAAWPLPASLGVRARARPPGGGHVQVTGRFGTDPLSADLRLTSRDAEIAPYRPYVPVPARISGRTDLDVAVVVPAMAEGRGTVRGRAAVGRLDVRDGERTVARAELASATGLDVDWPTRVAVRELHLSQPWVLLERDRDGALTLRPLLTPRAAGGAAAGRDSGPAARSGGPEAGRQSGPALAVTVGRVVVDNGGTRVVGHRVAPRFALDVQRMAARIDGLSTDPASRPARVELTGRTASTSLLELRGTLGSLGGPLRIDMSGELKGFAMPYANPYLIEHVAWEARQGWLTTAVRCRIDGDALDARTEIQLSRLQLARAGRGDQAQSRIGLPLGMIVALMKDSRGDIRVTVPVGGKLSDPRFDMSEVVWSTVRSIAMKAVAAPVSWIGRVQYTADARIESIEVDPIPFPPGQARLTPDAREQVSRVAAFLEQAPDVRMAIVPVVTARDRDALADRRDGSDRPVREGGEPRQDGGGPGSGEGTSTESSSVSIAAGRAGSADLSSLAVRRLEAVRDAIRKAGVAGDRLTEAPAAVLDGADGQVKLSLLEPEEPARPGRPNLLRRLLGEAPSGSRG